jgi:type IV pilus assembly protein PilB
MLLEANLIDEIQMQIALEVQRKTGKRFGSTLVDLKFIDENVLAAFLSKQVDIPCVSLLNIAIPPRVLATVPAEMARRHNAVPFKLEEGTLYVAMTDPTDINAVTEIEAHTGCSVTPLIAPQSSIDKVIQKHYEQKDPEDTLPSLKELGSLVEDLDPVEALRRILDRLDRVEAALRDLEARVASCTSSARK